MDHPNWTSLSVLNLEQSQSAVEQMLQIQQSRPDSGLGFQLDVLPMFQGVASSLGSCSKSHLTRRWARRPVRFYLTVNSPAKPSTRYLDLG